MCLIIVQPVNTPFLAPEDFDLAFEHNADGAGLAYSAQGKLVVDKPYFRAHQFYDAYLAALTKRTAGPVVLHFRYATHGGIDQRNTHPHLTCNQTIAVFHNGVLATEHSKGESDTRIWVKTVLWGRTYYQILSHRFIGHISNYIGSNKIVLLGYDGTCRILNRKLGHTDKHGVWYSNTYWRHPKTYTCYPTKARENYTQGFNHIEWWKNLTNGK